MNRISRRLFTKTFFSKTYNPVASLVLLVAVMTFVSCATPKYTQPVSDAEVNFSERKNYAITGGDTDQANLTGFERDSFGAFFAQSLSEILTLRGLSEVSASQTDSVHYIIRYILRDNLIITALDPSSKRLIWRGQSEGGLGGEKVSIDNVTELVKQAIGGFPPRR